MTRAFKLGWTIGGIPLVALVWPALSYVQRKDPAISFLCVFKLNGAQLCTVKHFEAVGLDGISTAVQVTSPNQLLPGEIRITSSDFSPAFRATLFGLLDHKPAVNSGSLVFFDTTLTHASSIEFGSVVLKEVEMPELNVKSNAVIELSLRLAVSNVTRPASPPPPPQPARTQAASNPPPGGQTSTRKDPLPAFLFKLSIDGLHTEFIPQIDKFRIVPGGTGDITFTMRALPVSNEFVDWKGSKAASLEYLDSSLKPAFKVGFTLTKRRLSETFDANSGVRTMKVECACSGVQAVTG